MKSSRKNIEKPGQKNKLWKILSLLVIILVSV